MGMHPDLQGMPKLEAEHGTGETQRRADPRGLDHRESSSFSASSSAFPRRRGCILPYQTNINGSSITNGGAARQSSPARNCFPTTFTRVWRMQKKDSRRPIFL